MSRIVPLEPPYDDRTGPLLESLMPAGVPPIGLFRTFALNPVMTEAMAGWGRYELGPSMSLSLRAREIVIDRTCALCRCEYEWGVHIAFFAAKARLGDAQVRSLTHGSPADPCWTDAAERALIGAVDQLHDRSTLDDAVWTELSAFYSAEQILDLLLLAGWYHAVCYAANGAGVELEPDAPRFADYRESAPAAG
ncbi:carboxymuconolactone decarboxylase family protein [Actinocorallia sp. B10E7]|uniref:carboxymuconolactone decarboxylase family protein n=1 Tax=Actinocorallia sp. B10E7 TaxID=3153558 RepID=UPI00325DD01D